MTKISKAKAAQQNSERRKKSRANKRYDQAAPEYAPEKPEKARKKQEKSTARNTLEKDEKRRHKGYTTPESGEEKSRKQTSENERKPK